MYRNDTITADDITAMLRKQFTKGHLWFEELRLSSGFGMEGRVDFYTLNVAPSTGNKAVAYEVKISRADFKRDSHAKQRGARLFCDQFYYIAPVGVIPHADVPDWAGLIEVSWHSTKYRPTPILAMKTVITAPKRDKDSPSWGLVCSMVRNSVRRGGDI